MPASLVNWQPGSGSRSRHDPAGHRAACDSHRPFHWRSTPAGLVPSAEHLPEPAGSAGSSAMHSSHTAAQRGARTLPARQNDRDAQQ